jgi:hypothetical protein
MYKIGDKAIYYDGTPLTFKKIICSEKGIIYYFDELPYCLNESEFSITALPFSIKRKSWQDKHWQGKLKYG